MNGRNERNSFGFCWLIWGPKKVMTRWHNSTPFAKCKSQHCVVDPLAHFQAVKAGLGFSHIQCFMADPDPELVRLQGEIKPMSSPAWILTHPDVVTTERVRVCMRFLREAICKQESLLSGQKYQNSPTHSENP